MKQLTHGSLFAGIGGFDLGFERAGIKTVWQVEIGEWNRRLLAKRFPGAEQYGDIRHCDSTNLRPVDVITGGFPCQPVSLAGLRRAQSDERWLWPEYERIIRLLRPAYVVVENVPGLLAAGMGDVISGLASVGYDAEWQSISAAAIGAPHIRDRVWIIAYPDSDQYQSRPSTNQGKASADVPPDTSGDLRGTSRHDRPEPPNGRNSLLADSDEKRRNGRPRIFGERWRGELENGDWWATEPDVGRVAHGIPARVDRLKGLGNSIVPQIAEWIGKRIIEAEMKL
jgi:DNA (cytosine-5)-methyltransferase 1